MLILSRRAGESIIIETTAEDGTVLGTCKIITLPNVFKGQCKLGFDADPWVKIYREELYESFKAGEQYDN